MSLRCSLASRYRPPNGPRVPPLVGSGVGSSRSPSASSSGTPNHARARQGGVPSGQTGDYGVPSGQMEVSEWCFVVVLGAWFVVLVGGVDHRWFGCTWIILCIMD